MWDALIADVRDFADRTRLAQQAEWRGLYRYAVELARPAAEAGQATAMQLMARRLAAAGQSADAEGWAQRAAEAGDTMAVQLYAKRLDEEGDRGGADAILRTAADVGDTSAIVGLAARLDEVGKTERTPAPSTARSFPGRSSRRYPAPGSTRVSAGSCCWSASSAATPLTS